MDRLQLVLPAFGARRVRKLDASTPVTLLKTQSIALRAVCLTHFVRFAMEYMTLCTPDTLFHPLDPAVPQRHFEALQRDLERLAPSLVDGPSTTAVLSSCSRLPWPPLVIAQATT